MTTPTMHPEMAKALALLTAGHTMQATAERTGWPIGRVRALINGQRGWLVDKNGRVYNPGRPGYKPQIPDGVDPADVERARQLLGDDSPRTVQFREPAPAKSKPAPAPAESPGQSQPPTPVKGSAAVDGLITTDLPIDKIHGNPGNIREQVGDVSELTASIRAHGLLQPLTVRPHPKVAGAYELLAGHRRHAAALDAGLDTVPVVIRPEVDDATAIEVMLVENVQRRDLNPMEKAEALGKLKGRGYTNALISSRTGIPDSTVSYLLALLELDEAGRQKVRTGEITAVEAVAAVRAFRKKQRRKQGGEERAWSWEPDYLTNTHPLARRAERMCNAREHTTRRRIGKVACGQCWETVIRGDERVVVAAEAQGEATA
ncbi:hypothetical protein GCM10009530_63310 [Microbispora corallina]|uniref:ParB-like N-terminal domain-containing protein n=1 Tax=Microbispora corallina TaxID=83302 RepID=A0ABQ4GBP9_9ACTN|nr:ParB/RepB/Spo0J family partition protein [Microbispora corallina]GIH44439.1 hypothetical protein Mco01_74390 [Microbispora corallina]